MAKPIKETPFLYGSDAENFVKENEEVTKLSKEEKEGLEEGYNALKSIAKFKI